MRLVVALLAAAALWGPAVSRGEEPTDDQQVITPLNPEREQVVQWIATGDEQRVEAIDPEEAQAIASGRAGTGGKVVSTMGKVGVALLGAAISVGYILLVALTF